LRADLEDMDVSLLLWYIWMILATFSLVSVLIKAIALLNHKTPTHGSNQPVSVVIAARNEGSKLENLITSILLQDYSNFELIIVLDRCTDDSLDIMKRLEPDHENLRTIIVDYLPEHFSPKKFALTLGIKGAKHACVLLTDADCLPSSNRWISHMASHFKDHTDFVIGYAPYTSGQGLLNQYINYETFTTGFNYLSSALIFKPYMAVGRNLMIRKSLFLKINGYNRFQHIQGGDDDLLIHFHGNRQNTTICTHHEALTYSTAHTNWNDYYHQKIRHLSIGKFYSRLSKFTHTIKWITSLALWLSFVILAIVRPDFLPVYFAFAGYLLIKGLTYGMVKRKMDKGFSPWTFPLFELMHLFVMPVFVLGARVTTKVKWK
jgi:cellulose synthase/poly-beta-1,6-N-acetylglucosamine synthase-like glycosyltransferase